jgi:hypothetical protein
MTITHLIMFKFFSGGSPADAPAVAPYFNPFIASVSKLMRR